MNSFPSIKGPSTRARPRPWRPFLWLFAWLLVLLSGCSSLPGLADSPESSSVSASAGTRLPSNANPSRDGRRTPSASGGLRPIETGSTYALPIASLTPPADLWDRIRRGFAMPDLEGDLARDRTEWYAARGDYFYRMTERSRKYLFHIVEELERRDMPAELALLPFVESAFNPQAVSSAKAAGMWQFMPATGKDFELKQNMFRDDRRDVLASTRAALDYLQQLYGMFNDWHLALAAYNWGQGNVKKAIERNQKRGLPTGYADLTMPNETRLYVPKLQAIKNLVASPGENNVRLPYIGNHPFFDTVTIDRDIDVALAARLAELNEEDFRELNPSLHRPVILASGTPNILLPWDNAATFKRNLQFHLGPMATWTAWAVPGSMKTAEIAKRFNMPESDLRSLNKIPPGMLVRAGSTLLVPRLGVSAEHEVPEHLADKAHLALQPEVVLYASKVQARKGDSLDSLAKRHHVSATDVAKWNKLPLTAALKAGQALTIYTEKRVTSSASAAQPSRGAQRTPPPSRQAVKPAPARKAAPASSQRKPGSAPNKR